jgi:N-acetylglucosaminyldiphosphoundecaprenol N-acetyl-beta-D-mannosaminyltransferase
MLHVCTAAAREGIPIGLFGGSEATLAALCERLACRFPALSVALRLAPPFTEIGAEEDARIVEAIAQSGARIVFVGLGCPKQERWMDAHVGRVNVPMLGVGAAFDFHSGRVKQAPSLVQRAGLEWAWRLAREPRRLAGRYLKHNPRFAALAARELAGRGLGYFLGGSGRLRPSGWASRVAPPSLFHVSLLL